MTAFRPPLARRAPDRRRPRTRPRTRARTAAALTAVCCLTALPTLSALPAAASPGAVRTAGAAGSADGGRGSSGSPASSEVVAGGALLAEPGVHVQQEDGVPSLPSGLSALAWTVSDARTGQVLAAKNAHRRLPPASCLKTLFADVVIPRFPGPTTHKVTDEDLAGIGEGSSLVGVQAGQTYTVADLWRGVFLASGNDAVHVLAHMNGSVPLTVEQMQAKAEMLGANDTHVVSPDGYDAPGQVSSAYDLAVFARAGLRNPDFAEYAGTKDAQFPGGYDTHGNYVASFGIQNTNRLLTGAQGVTPYPGVIGVKNGYTTNAGNTLIAAARHGDRTLIVTVMNPQSGLPQAVYTEATKLLDWGFDAVGRTSSVGTLNAARPVALQSTGTGAGAPPADDAKASSTPPRTPPSTPASARTASTSATAWYIGGALVLTAAACVLLLRRRSTSKPR